MSGLWGDGTSEDLWEGLEVVVGFVCGGVHVLDLIDGLDPLDWVTQVISEDQG